MDTHDNARVIPFVRRPLAAATADPGFYLSRGHTLAERRGLETIDIAPPASLGAGREADKRGACKTAAAETANIARTDTALNAARLSELFIASLDDMIRRVETSPADTISWPSARDTHLEHVALEIVGMLYGFVPDAQELPAGVKTALDRLQMPMLQMAMRDIAFFTDWRHPARRLLDATPRLYATYRHRGGCGSAFESHFVGLLDDLLATQPPNAAGYACILEQLQTFAEGAPFAEGSDETGAWERAEEAARQALERGLPELVRDFLAEYWIDTLQQTALKHGEGSPLWHDAVAVIDDLAWSLAPKAEQSARFELIAEIPALLARINRGLDLAGVPGEARRDFFDALAARHTELLRADTPQAAHHASAHESAIAQVHRMQRGDWVEFYLADGSHSRNRLTWISPQRGILVFSNQRGERAIQLDPEELAGMIARHQAMIIFDHVDSDSDRNSA